MDKVTFGPVVSIWGSRTVCVGLCQWWKELLTNVRLAESLAVVRKRLNTHLIRLPLDPASHDSKSVLTCVV